MTTRKQLDCQLQQATTNREIAEICAHLATLAWRTGDNEAFQRLEFWFYALDIYAAKLPTRQQVWLSPASLTEIEGTAWVLDRQWNQPITPRRCAKSLIYSEAAQGDPVEWIMQGGKGAVNSWYKAQVGGYYFPGGAWEREEQPINLGAWRIGVSAVMKTPCRAIFDLRKIYDEIRQECTPGAIVQLSFF